MTRRNQLVRLATTHLAAASLAFCLPAFLVWTWLVRNTHVLYGFDAYGRHQHLVAGSPAAQVWSAISICTLPGVLITCLVVVSVWAWRRRLRNLAWALVLSVSLTWCGNHLLKLLFLRPRPDSPLADVITYHGRSYPSGHVAMATTAAAMVIATTTTTRQHADVRWLWGVLGVGGVLLVGYDRLVMNAHWPSDVVAGLLVGLMSASFSCLVCRVHMLPVPVHAPADQRRRTCAVIWNPTKVFDASSMRRAIDWELASRGWDDALWLQTRADDPGVAMARAAIDAGVDMVLVAGGDGTVRVVCGELANTGIAVAIIPAGTGNLLARNLGIPLDAAAAAELAFVGTPRPIDLVRVTVDDDRDGAQMFAVMAGIGIDARIMDETPAELKKLVGSAAYFATAARQVGAPPMELVFQVDDQPPQRRLATLAVLGNVGLLQGNIPMFPQASATDGKLDLVVASPKGLGEWGPMTARYLLGRGRRPVDRVDQLSGRRVRLTVAERMPYELDGDTNGTAHVFHAEVVPGALLLVQP